MAMHDESAQSWMCECRLTHNYFVHGVGKHFVFNGDEHEFRRSYSASLKPHQVDTVLEALREQREERLGAATETLRRVERIAREYAPLHREVYSLDPQAFLDSDFRLIVDALKASQGSGAACVRDLQGRGLLKELRPGLWTFPVLSETFCDWLEAELSHFRSSGLPCTAPNTMNRHGVILSELGFYPGLLDPFVYRYVDVVASRLVASHTEGLDSYRAFTVLYDAQKDGDRELALHYDNAEVTLNVNIGGQWEGGQVAFYGLCTEPENSRPPYEVTLRRGHGVLHAGLDLHKALPITSGSRHNLIIWSRSSGVRNDLCPMCFRQPKVVPTNKYHNEGFTVPPCSQAVPSDDELYD